MRAKLTQVGHPAQVNLAVAMQAISGPDVGYFNNHRIKDLDDDQVTITVQSKDDVSQGVDKTIKFSDVSDTFCKPQRGVWPCVVAEALRQAGWDVNKPNGHTGCAPSYHRYWRP
jgi:hypothetical protein